MANVNWKCPNCNSFNSPRRQECWSCGTIKHTLVQKDKSKQISLTILVTIIVAVIGLIGTSITAFVNYQGIRLQVEKPIMMTMTAEANKLTPTPLVRSTNEPIDGSKIVRSDSNWAACMLGGPRVVPKDISLDKNDAVNSYLTFQNAFGEWPPEGADRWNALKHTYVADYLTE